MKIRLIYVFILIFLLLLSCSCITFALSDTLNLPFALPSFGEDEETTAVPDTQPADTTEAQTTTEAETTVPETTVPETTVPETTQPPETTAAPETTAPPVTTTPPVTTAPSAPTTDYVTEGAVDKTVFDNALFIGDSRTVGIKNFGGLGNADVFASTGLNMFRAFTETINVQSIGDTKLEPLLESKKYDKVYIMLGINEMGYPIEPLRSKYTQLVNTIKEHQPDATIYILANLHIKHVRSENDNTFKNSKLNEINAMQASLADGVKIKYLDVNVIFDDENKALGAGYASDDFHPYPKYYLQWSQWLAIHSN